MGIATIFNSLFKRQYKPEYYFQLDSNNLNIVNHKVFGLSNVHLYIWIPMEYPRNPPGYPGVTDFSPRGYAINAVNWIEYNRNLLRGAFPRKTFKYGLCPAGFYHNNPYTTVKDSLSDHEGDKLTHNGLKYQGPYHAVGIAKKAEFMDIFYRELAAELALRRLPKPQFIDPDDETVFANFHYTGDLTVDYDIVANDPRFTTEKIDGILTLQEFFAQHKLIDGTSNPIVGKFPKVYDTSNPNSAYWACSLNMRIRDYALHESHNKYVKKYLGKAVDCHNWCQFAASRDNPAYLVRFKESATDYNGAAFRQDCQVWSTYGWYWVDSKWLDNIGGYKTFNDCLRLFKVPADLPLEEQIERIHLGEIEFNLNACRLAAPTKPIVLWLGWQDQAYSDDKVPSTGGHLSMTHDTMLDTLYIAKNNQVARIGLFEPTLNVEMADRYYRLLTTKIYL